MKILPNYLIDYMPILEEAMEELRLSVIDRAYDLLKCLDLDELSTDDIRNKLELYNLKVENMTEQWLPNGRFYRMYPEIKHNRTRLNAIKSIAQSGGQFEGVWSTGFSSKPEFKFKNIQIMRHYYLGSAADGYLYVSGNSSVSTGLSGSTAVQALQTDILINQALPAGYTYLYIPWPRPNYPTDSGYFYNIHMLDFDRLFYIGQDMDDDGNIIKTPASERYSWDTGEGTPYRTPYWFDYHESVVSGELIRYEESGTYTDLNGNAVVDPKDAVYYILDKGEDGITKDCRFLNDEAGQYSVFPTSCYSYSRNNTTVPSRDQLFSELSNKDHIATIDENYFTDSELTTEPGAYRFDYINDSYHCVIRDSHYHIKQFRPIWNESSPFSLMTVSDRGSDIQPNSIVANSLFNWFKYKEDNTQPAVTDSTRKSNEPSISELTHTDCNRPSLQAMRDKMYCCYFSEDFDDINFISGIDLYALYCPGDKDDGSNTNNYDPTKFYQAAYVVHTDDETGDLSQKDLSLTGAFILGDPYTKELYFNKNGNDFLTKISEASYVVYRVSDSNRVWTSPNEDSVKLDKKYNILYTRQNHSSSDEIYYLSDIANSRDLVFSDVVAYDNEGNVVDLAGSSLCLYTQDGRYYLSLKTEETCASNLSLNGAWEYTTYDNIKSVSSIYASSQNGFTYLNNADSEKEKILSLSEDEYIILNNLRDGNAYGTTSFSESNAMSLMLDLSDSKTIHLKFMNNSEHLYDGLTIRDKVSGETNMILGFRLNSAVSSDYSSYKDKDWYKLKSYDTWHDVSFTLSAGKHTLWFNYEKDGSVSRYSDCSFVAIPKEYIEDLSGSKLLNISYIDYKVKSVSNTPALDRSAIEVPILHQQFGLETTASYYASDNRITFPYAPNPTVIKTERTLEDFYEDGWIIKKYKTKKYIGDTLIDVWYDDKDSDTIESAIKLVAVELSEDDPSETWSFE